MEMAELGACLPFPNLDLPAHGRIVYCPGREILRGIDLTNKIER